MLKTVEQASRQLKDIGRACLYIYWIIEKRIALRTFRKLRPRFSASSLPDCSSCPPLIRKHVLESQDLRKGLLEATVADFEHYTREPLARTRIAAVLSLMGAPSALIFRTVSICTAVFITFAIGISNVIALYVVHPDSRFASVFSGFDQAFVVPYANTIQVEWDFQYNPMTQDHVFVITAYTPGLHAENYGGVVFDLVPRWPSWAEWCKLLFFTVDFTDKDWTNRESIVLSAKAEGCSGMRVTVLDDSGGRLDEFVPLTTSLQTSRIPLPKTGSCDLSRIGAVHLHIDGSYFSDNNCRIMIRSFKVQ